MDVTVVLKLRVIFGDDSAEKLTLPSCPKTVDALTFEIKQKWDLAYDFRLQFEDPEFHNALFILINMEDLPSSKATIKIV